MDALEKRIDRLEEHLNGIATLLNQLIQQPAAKDWYSIAELAKLVRKAEFTVREWCRLGRIHAQKRACGRGPVREWMISRDELVRYQNHGLLPVPRMSTKV